MPAGDQDRPAEQGHVVERHALAAFGEQGRDQHHRRHQQRNVRPPANEIIESWVASLGSRRRCAIDEPTVDRPGHDHDHTRDQPSSTGPRPRPGGRRPRVTPICSGTMTVIAMPISMWHHEQENAKPDPLQREPLLDRRTRFAEHGRHHSVSMTLEYGPGRRRARVNSPNRSDPRIQSRPMTLWSPLDDPVGEDVARSVARRPPGAIAELAASPASSPHVVDGRVRFQ